LQPAIDALKQRGQSNADGRGRQLRECGHLGFGMMKILAEHMLSCHTRATLERMQHTQQSGGLLTIIRLTLPCAHSLLDLRQQISGFLIENRQ
jgi:hypothetical protein